MYGYLPGRKASMPIGWYQIILLGDRGTCMSLIYYNTVNLKHISIQCSESDTVGWVTGRASGL